MVAIRAYLSQGSSICKQADATSASFFHTHTGAKVVCSLSLTRAHFTSSCLLSEGLFISIGAFCVYSPCKASILQVPAIEGERKQILVSTPTSFLPARHIQYAEMSNQAGEREREKRSEQIHLSTNNQAALFV